MKLQDLLGEELYAQVQSKLDEVNGKEPDKLKHVRYADLSEGDYVSKSKFELLDAENRGNLSKLTEANSLIDKLKNAANGDEELQKQVTSYQSRVEKLEEELERTKIDAAVKVGLLAEDVIDVDYLTFKLKEKGEKLELDEQGHIKGWNDKVAALKTQLPGQFKTDGKGRYDGFRPMDDTDGRQNHHEGMTKEELLKKPYAQQVKFFNENPDAYNEIMKG